MKQSFIIALILLTRTQLHAKPPRLTSEQQVGYVYQIFTQAADHHRVATVSRYIANDALFVDCMSSRVRTKAEFLSDVADVSHEAETVHLPRGQIQIKVQGHTAGIIETINITDKKPFQRIMNTIIFVKRNRHWQIVAATSGSG